MSVLLYASSLYRVDHIDLDHAEGLFPAVNDDLVVDLLGRLRGLDGGDGIGSGSIQCDKAIVSDVA